MIYVRRLQQHREGKHSAVTMILLSKERKKKREAASDITY